jgi:amino-acid N-acetyltransferase
MISAPTSLDVHKASMRDIGPILELINSYAAKGIMLARTEFEVSEHIRDFSVAYQDGRLAGCAALHFYTPTSAEVRSLAVEPEMTQHGVGRVLVEALEREARAQDLESIFAFTYVPGFFHKLGFNEVDRGELPLKVWKDCLRCPKFQNCDEIAVLKRFWPAARDEKPCPSQISTRTSKLIRLPVVNQPTFR